MIVPRRAMTARGLSELRVVRKVMRVSIGAADKERRSVKQSVKDRAEGS
jgi:hypothetical protein